MPVISEEICACRWLARITYELTSLGIEFLSTDSSLLEAVGLTD